MGVDSEVESKVEREVGIEMVSKAESKAERDRTSHNIIINITRRHKSLHAVLLIDYQCKSRHFPPEPLSTVMIIQLLV